MYDIIYYLEFETFLIAKIYLFLPNDALYAPCFNIILRDSIKYRNPRVRCRDLNPVGMYSNVQMLCLINKTRH